MNRLKQFINSCSEGIETYLTSPLDIQNYPKRQRKLMLLFKRLLQEFHQQFFEMQVVESQLNASSQQMITTLDSQKQNTDLMYAHSTKLEDANTSSMNQIDQTLFYTQQLKEDIFTLENSSKKLTHSTTESKCIVLEQVNHINSIIQQIDTIKISSTLVSGSVESLSQSIKEIAGILESVQNFYKQTQLLALNASIESARAGEAGKGFAVVASEIRHLAEGSSNSVEKIVSIMNDIDFSIGSVKETTLKESQSIQSAVSVANNIEKGLDLIKSSYLEVDENLGLVNSLLKKNHDSVVNMDTSLNATFDAYQVVEAEINSLREEINQQQAHTENIFNLKDNLNDISTSIHILTNRYPLDLIAQNQHHLEGLAAGTIKKLELLCQQNTALSRTSTSDHKQIIDTLLEKDTTIEAAWTNTFDGNFIYSNPPAGIKNGTIRSWFQESIRGNTFVSDFYISGISKGPCVTVSIPLKDVHHNIIGVLGVDLRFSTV